MIIFTCMSETTPKRKIGLPPDWAVGAALTSSWLSALLALRPWWAVRTPAMLDAQSKVRIILLLVPNE